MQVVAVDWSGAVASSAGIWLARAGGGRLLELWGGRPRPEVVERLVDLADAASGQLAVGLDFSFSLPAWFLGEHGLESAPELWALAEQEGERWLAECRPPFWGRPGTKRPDLVAHLRQTEAALAPVAGIRPKSTFQIGGAGSVGTSSIRGMPHLLRLQAAGFSIWPFDEPRLPVVVEIWPRLFTGPVVKRSAAARRAHLSGAVTGSMARHQVDVAASSEDAFDAAVSAVAMDRQADELAALDSPAAAAAAKIEGSIWLPRQIRADEVRTDGTLCMEESVREQDSLAGGVGLA